MEKPKLFEDRRSFLLFLLLMSTLLLIRLGWTYHNYRTFVSKPFYYTYATVISAHIKSKAGHRYQVLKLKSEEGYQFYTTTHHRKAYEDTILRLQIFPDTRITFLDFLGTFYVKSRIKSIEESPAQKSTLPTRQGISKRVALQHSDPQMGEFYSAIFFATPLSMQIRDQISRLGTSHLVALSGFHLGILWGVLYAMILMLYRPLQQHYFPYRYALIDIGAAVLVLLGVYVWFVGAPPSLLRSYVMLAVGWIVLILGMELLSFQFLAAVAMILLVLFPSLLVSLAFWLSVAGVFYIFLLLHYFGQRGKWLISLLIIPVGIFLLMLPIVHSLFGTTTKCQLLSPLLSLLFVPFYPLAILLHLVGKGDLLDPVLQGLFALECPAHESLLPWWMVAGYVGLSLAAIRYRWAFYGLLGAALSCAIYLFVL